MDELLNRAPCGFLSFADDGRITLVNATLLEWLGYREEAVVGRHVESLMPLPGRIFYQTHFFPLLKLHGNADEIYLSLRSSRGENVPVMVNALRRDREGHMANDCVIVPMRQRRRYEDELLAARRAAETAMNEKSRFLSTMSHEIRTPLQAISGYIDILSEGIHGSLNDLQMEDLKQITRAIDYLLGLINDTLNLSRLESGHVEMRLESIPVDVALSEAEALVARRIEESGLQYVRERSDPGVAVVADRDRLQQILLNLITNAIKFTRPGGRISVGSDFIGNTTYIHVGDTGRGIPGDQIERIFEPFVQMERQSSELNRQGAGLGLAISRELARAMGGDLTVESIVDQGSVFTITLPASESRTENGERRTEEESRTEDGGRRKKSEGRMDKGTEGRS